MRLPKTIKLLAGLGMLGLVLAPGALHAGNIEDERDAVRDMRDEVLAELYELKPNAEGRIKKAEGYAVFSNVGINLVFASFAGGHGIVVDKDGHETFMKMGSAGLGLGLGVKDFRGVFVFYDRKKLNDFIEHGWDFSAQADAAAKSDTKGGQLALAGTVQKGVEVYQFTENGLALQATLQGTKFWRDPALN
jgi:lipid-binding SYLF domain-containing protein